jgi:hypothetical protein
MKVARFSFLLVFMVLFFSALSFSQEAGDYRSAANGIWSAAGTWETFDGAAWVAAVAAPIGAENITVDNTDTVYVDIPVLVTGYVLVIDTALIEVGDGSMEFATGSTYEHARDAGSVPVAVWDSASTFLLTGTIHDSPGNRNQDFYDVTINTPDLDRNRDFGWNGNTIGGNVYLIDSGINRWQLTTASANNTAEFTIMGDVIVDAGALAVQGTSNANTTFIVHHYGNINVTGGNFSLARGSQGSGSGTTTWYLYAGNFSMLNATIQNSNPTMGNAILVFASGDTQQVSFDNVTVSSPIHFRVDTLTTMQITTDFTVTGLLYNKGTVDPLGSLTFADGSVYQHALDAGSIPTATWEEGSTMLLTGTVQDAPSNRVQNFYNVTFNTPYLGRNRDMGWNGNTIGGDITVISTGANRWQMSSASANNTAEFTIMGDVIVENGNFTSNGTSNANTTIIVHQHGDVIATGGNLSVSRGSQGSGSGTTTWYLHEGNLSLTNTTTQSSNPTAGNAKFVFDSATPQTITLDTVSYGSGGLPLEVAGGTTLDFGLNMLKGDGMLILNQDATLATANPGGLDSTLQNTGKDSINVEANFTFNGTEAQVPGVSLPDSVGTLTITNTFGVTFSDTLVCTDLELSAGALMNIDTLSGNITAGGGNIAGTIVNKGVLTAVTALAFEDGSVYQHALEGGAIPSGTWNEGSTLLLTGTTDTNPGNRNQSYYNITINTPGLVSNRDLALDGITIGGDVTVQNTGLSRWRLSNVSAGDTAIFNIMGDIIVTGGSLETHGTSNAYTVFEVHHYGDVNVTGGNFSVCRGSQGSGTGSTRWYMHQGNFSMANATTQNSNTTNSWFVFDSDTVQTISLSNVTYGGGGLQMVVASGTTLDFGLSQLGGSGLFTLHAGAALATADAGGLNGTLQNTGTKTLSDSASYIFNGTVAQVTGLLMPVIVNDLTIDNEAGVTLSQETTINGVLHLKAGVFDNTISFHLGPEGSISYEGGSLLHDPTSVESEPAAELPKVFALYQNYPNPFNPATIIRYDIPKQSDVIITVYDVMGRRVTELVNGRHNAGAYKVEWNARGYASGLYYYRITASDFVSVKKLVLMK